MTSWSRNSGKKIISCLRVTNGCIHTFSTANQIHHNYLVAVILQIRRWKITILEGIKVKYIIGSMTSLKLSSQTDQNSTTSFTQSEATQNRSRPDLSIWAFQIMTKESRSLENPQMWAIINIRSFLWPNIRGDLIVRLLPLIWWGTPQATRLYPHPKKYLNKNWTDSWSKSRSLRDWESRKTTDAIRAPRKEIGGSRIVLTVWERSLELEMCNTTWNWGSPSVKSLFAG